MDVARTNDEAQGGRAIERQFVISLGVGLLVGGVPWNVYSLTSIAVIAGLTHVPHV